MKLPQIAASILDADYTKLRDEIQTVNNAGIEMFSLDIMDNTFVPRITFGPVLVAQIREWTDAYIDCHLMVDSPSMLFDDLAAAGVDSVTFHIETVTDLSLEISRIKKLGMEVGVAINIETPISSIFDVLDDIDIVNLMGVKVGWGGQALSDTIYKKIQGLVDVRDQNNLSFVIQIDGGVKLKNIEALIETGADVVTVGTGIYHQEDRISAVSDLNKVLGSVASTKDLHESKLSLLKRKRIRSDEDIYRLSKLAKRLDISESTWYPSDLA